MKRIKLTRWGKRPLLGAVNKREHWWESRSVFNPGVAVKNGKIYLLYRALAKIHYSNFGLAILKDPLTIEKRLSLPVFEPEADNPYERFGVEDPRIIFMEKKFWVVYNAASFYFGQEKVPPSGRALFPWKLRCCLASTKDFVHYQRHGVILPNVDTKDGTLFPEKINGKYVLLHRIFPDIWISFSKKIDKFPNGEILCSVRKNNWDSSRIGAGAPPIKTPLGWLEFYHGAQRLSGKKRRYLLGILLFDLKNPRKILYRSPEPIFEPEERYEKRGYVNDVVFTCGAIEWEGKYYVYYGAADTCINVAFIDKKKLLNALLERTSRKEKR